MGSSYTGVSDIAILVGLLSTLSIAAIHINPPAYNYP